MRSDLTGDAVPERLPPRHRPLIPVLVGLATGIAADEALAPPFALWMALGWTLILLALWAAVRRLRPWGNWLLALLLLVPVGGAYHHVRFRQKPPWHLTNLPLKERALYRLRGVVRGDPTFHFARRPLSPQNGPGVGFWLVRVGLTGISSEGERWHRVRGGVAVFVREGLPTVMPGDRVEFVSALEKNSRPTNPGERDRGKAFARSGSYATASVPSGAAFEVLSESPWYSPLLAVSNLRVYLKGRLIWNAPRPLSGLTASLVFGERGRIEPELAELLKDSGVLHFLAISGLHVGIFAGFVWLILLWAGIPIRLRSAVLIGLLWLYVLFTGSRAPGLRAGCMLSLAMAGPLLRRRYDFVSSLVASALIILLINPSELFSAGFQLTFVAVWAIVYLYWQLAKILWPWESFLARAQQPEERSFFSDTRFCVRHAALLSFCVWVATAPLIAYHFNRVCLLAPLISLLVWPLILPLLLCAFLLVLSVLAGGLGAGLLVWCTGFFSSRIETLLEVASRLPGFVHFTAGPPAWWVALFYVGVSLWVLRQRLARGRGAFLVLVIGLSLTYIWSDVRLRSLDSFRMIVTDVGHGSAVVMRCPDGSTALFDAGSYRTGACRAVAELLWAQRVEGIDPLILSHRNFDHCCFVPYLAKRFAVGKIVIPAAGELNEFGRRLHALIDGLAIREVTVSEGRRIAGGGLRCLALHPDSRFIQNPRVSANDKSLVLLCRFGSCKFLLTGDNQHLSMERLADTYGPSLKADVLLMPHHALFAEGLEEFIRLCAPLAAVASCAKGADIERSRAMLARLGIPLWTTADDGAIIIEVRQAKLSIEGYKSGKRAEFVLDEATSNGKTY